MKISNSKKELARIISENGGWRDGARFAWYGNRTKKGWFGISKPLYSPKQKSLRIRTAELAGEFPSSKVANWHQTILSRAEYFHLYPVPDADGWIEWSGGDIDIDDMQLVDYKMACTPDGKYHTSLSMNLFWDKVGEPQDIIAYRLHKPEQAEPEFCESVMRSIPEPEIHSKNTALTQVDDINVVESKPTIEQLAADYRNRKDYTDRKQQEADAAKADADSKLAELVAAGKALGLVLSVAGAESELVITDWRDLRFGDVIEYVDGRNKNRVGMVGRVDRVDLYNADTDRPIRMVSDNGQVSWPTKWRFIRRPAK